jgi:hypothetical protein
MFAPRQKRGIAAVIRTRAHIHACNLRKNRISSRLIVGFAGIEIIRQTANKIAMSDISRVFLATAAFPQNAYRTSSKNILLKILLDGKYELLFSCYGASYDKLDIS